MSTESTERFLHEAQKIHNQLALASSHLAFAMGLNELRLPFGEQQNKIEHLERIKDQFALLIVDIERRLDTVKNSPI